MNKNTSLPSKNSNLASFKVGVAGTGIKAVVLIIVMNAYIHRNYPLRYRELAELA